MGVTDFVNPKECKKPVHEEIKEIVEGGVDYSFECAGNLDVLREAFLSTHEVSTPTLPSRFSFINASTPLSVRRQQGKAGI
ncbi:hypothetical protein ACLOJK_006314 [Asimina triloba]